MGINYESCTSVNHDQLWCPTKDSGPTCMDCWSNDTFTHWENCNDKCKGKIIGKIEDKTEGKSFENALKKIRLDALQLVVQCHSIGIFHP